jgi:hypothetical protein
MAIKYLNPKSYGEVLQRLINGYKKVKGINPQGLDLIKVKLEAMEQIRESKKIIKLPEEKITDYTKDRPTEGPKAEVEKFPKENIVRKQSDLIEDRINKTKSNNEKRKKSIFEISDELKELADETRNTSVGDFLKDYFNLPKKTKKSNPSPIKGSSKDKVTSAEDIIKDDDFDPSGMAGGGLAYLLGEEPVKMGKGGAIKKALEAALKKLGNKVTTADKIKRPESALRREMFDDFNKRNKKAYGGRIGFAQGANKKMMIVDLLNKGADLDLIKTITEASDEEIMEAVDFFKYGGAGVPLPTFDESGKMIDDGLYKGRETRPEAKAYGGRIGFSAGGIDKVRRGFLKLLGAGAGAAVTAKTGLFGLMKGGKKTADVAKVATKVAGVAPNQPPSYLFDLVKVIREKGKDITKSAQTIERETVKTYKGVDLYENPDGFRIKAEGVSPYEGGKEIELMYSKTEEVKDLGLETQKSFNVTDYEEVTVRPDPDGKMKDVEFYVDENDHNKLKKIVEDETSEKGGLGYLIGEK